MALSPKTRNSFQQLFLTAADEDKDLALAGLRLVREYQTLLKISTRWENEVYRLRGLVGALEADRDRLQTEITTGVLR